MIKNIMDKMERKHITISLIILFVGFVLYSHLFEGVLSTGDDHYFSNAVQDIGNGSLQEFLDIRYHTWSGRIVIESLLVTFIGMNEWIWRILNSIVVLILVVSMYKMIPIKNISTKNEFQLKCLAAGSIFLMNVYVYRASVSWVTGSFNYLWPVAFGLVSIIPFKKEFFEEPYSKKMYPIYIMSSLLACNMEQAAAVTLCFSLLVNIWIMIEKKKINALLVIHSIFMLLNTILLAVAPGNDVRYESELQIWYPEYEMLGFVPKLYRGSELVIHHIIDNSTLITVIISVLLIIIIWDRYKDKLIRVLSTVPLIAVLFYGMSAKFHLPIRPNTPELEYIQGESTQFIAVGFWLGVLILMGYLITLSGSNYKDKLYMFILYGASIAATLILCLSPTMYASAQRIFFVTDILQLIILLSLSYEVIARCSPEVRLKGSMFVKGILVITVLQYIVHIAT